MGGNKGWIEGVDGMTVGSHACWSFDDDVAFEATLVRYIDNGLRAGQRVVAFVAPRRLGSLRDRLTSAIAGAEQAMHNETLVVDAFGLGYGGAEGFRGAAQIRTYETMTRAALADGFTGVRAFGEATPLLNNEGSRSEWIAYELRADLLARRVPFTALCGYDVRDANPEGLASLRAVHSELVGTRGQPPFRLHASDDGALAFGGELDFATSDLVMDLAAASASDLREPVLDLSALEFIDVAGMRAVIEGSREIGRRHGRVVLRGASSSFLRLWALLGCENQVEAEFEGV